MAAYNFVNKLIQRKPKINGFANVMGCLIGQAFRFMVGPGHCPMISKYGPSLSKAVGPVDSSFLVVKISHYSYSKSTNSESTCRLSIQ